MVSLVAHVAVDENGVIEKDGKLPWRLPSDLARFRALTIGRPVIMGRKTFETLGRPLDRRLNIVLTREVSELSYEFIQDGESSSGVAYVPNLDGAVVHSVQFAWKMNSNEVAVLGGARVYEQFMAMAKPAVKRVYMTIVHTEVGDGLRFPALDARWTKTVVKSKSKVLPADEFETTHVVYDWLDA